MSKPYIRNCQGCFKDFATSDPKSNFHASCIPEKKTKKKYSKYFKSIRQDIFIRDKFSCQACNIDLKNDDLRRNVIFIDGDTTNESTDNLVTVCSDCNRKIRLKQKSFSFRVRKIVIKRVISQSTIQATGKNQFLGV